MIEKDLYYVVLMIAAAINIVMGASLLIDNSSYRDYNVYRRSRTLTALTLFVFAAGFIAHSLLNWRTSWPVGASTLSISYFHIAAVLFGWSHISLLNPNYMTRHVVVRDIVILVLGLIAYWTVAANSQLSDELYSLRPSGQRILISQFSFAIFFIHALFISSILYRTLLRVRRLTKSLPQNESNTRWWTNENRLLVIGFQRSIRVSCHLIVIFGLGSVLVTAAFPDQQWPYIVLMALGIGVFCYIYYGLVEYGSVIEAGTNATMDININNICPQRQQ